MRSIFSILSFIFLIPVLQGQCEFIGRVSDVEGVPVSGANIVIVELNRGTVSDKDGRFTISDVPVGKHEIVVSFIGYERVKKSVEVKPKIERFLLNITMKEAAFSFDELVIQSTRAAENAPFAFDRIEGEALQKQNLGQDVPFLLQWTPSVVTTSDAGAGIGYTGVRIRGSDGERINVTINGIPLNDAESQRVYWVDLPDFAGSADDIQIQRGVGTSTNGSGAFGASINLGTNDLKEVAYAGFTGAIGSFNTVKRSLSFGSGILNNHFVVNGRLSKITSDGYIDRASSDLSSHALSIAYLGNASMLRFNIFSGHEVTYQAWYGIGEELANDEKTRTFNPAGTEKQDEPYDNQVDDYRQQHFQLFFDQQISSNFKLQAALHYTRGGGFYEEYKGDENYAEYGLPTPMLLDTMPPSSLIRQRWLENDFYGGLLTGVYTSNDTRMKLTFGGAYHQYVGRHFGKVIWARYPANTENDHIYYDEDANKNDGNVFAKINYQIYPKVSVYGDMQLRKVDYSFLGVNDELNREQLAVNYLFFNPKVGITYSINTGLGAYLSAAVANREPNRNDLVDTPVSKQPTAEQLFDIEAGLNGVFGKFAWKANLYEMLYKNQLALTGRINDVGEYTRINVPKSSRLGVELQMKWQPVSQLEFGMNTSLSRNKVDAFDEYIDTYDEDFNWLTQTVLSHTQTDLPFSPAVIGGLMLTYKPRKAGLQFDLQTKYVGRQFIDLAMDVNNQLAAYSFTNMGVAYDMPSKWTRKLRLSFFVKNVFDQLYVSNAWSYRYRIGDQNYVDKGLYPQAGRNYYLMINWRF